MTTLGIWSDGAPGHTTADLEAKIGRRFAGYRLNKNFDAPFPANNEVKAADAGPVPFVNYRNAQSEDPAVMAWSNWPKGTYDHYLDALIAGVKADGRYGIANPYLFSFHHEATMQHEANSTPEQYKAAFRYISLYLGSRSTAVETVWTDTLAGITKGSYDPNTDAAGKRIGDFYDVLGLDCYQRPQAGHLKRTPAQVTAAAHARAKTYGIPFAWVECGVAEGAKGEKAKFFSGIVPALKSYGTGAGSCVGLYYSNVGLVVGKDLFYPDTAVDSLHAFTAMAQDPWFA